LLKTDYLPPNKYRHIIAAQNQIAERTD